MLCKISPIPATSDRWMEVGDEVRNVSVAYGVDGDDDSGSDRYMSKDAGVVGPNKMA